MSIKGYAPPDDVSRTVSLGHAKSVSGTFVFLQQQHQQQRDQGTDALPDTHHRQAPGSKTFRQDMAGCSLTCCLTALLCVFVLVCVGLQISGIVSRDWKVTQGQDRRILESLWWNCTEPVEATEGTSSECTVFWQIYDALPLYLKICQVLMPVSLLFSVLGLLLLLCGAFRESVAILKGAITAFLGAGLVGVAGVILFSIEAFQNNERSNDGGSPGWSFITSTCGSALMVSASIFVVLVHHNVKSRYY